MKNITFSLDEELLKLARQVASEKNTTLAKLIRSYLEQLTGAKKLDRQERAARLQLSFNTVSSPIGKFWRDRDELHER